MGLQPEIESVSIVVLGSFNPAILHPSWLAANSLIKQQEAEDADTEIVHSQISKFKTEWLNIVVTTDRFQLLTSQEPYYEALRDLAMGIFMLLRHTPLTAIGINREFHYRLESEKKWHNVGNILAPKEIWNELNELFLKPGLSNLSIRGERKDCYKGYLLTKVEPSPRIIINGLFLSVNDHYELSPENSTGARECIKLIESKFTDSLENAKKIAEKIVSLGE